jgi:hypothetical protein
MDFLLCAWSLTNKIRPWTSGYVKRLLLPRQSRVNSLGGSRALHRYASALGPYPGHVVGLTYATADQTDPGVELRKVEEDMLVPLIVHTA